MPDGTKIDDILNALRFGFFDADPKESIRDLLILWGENIGLVQDQTRIGPEALTFKSHISKIRLGGMGIVPCAVLGQDDESAHRAVAEVVRETSGGRVVGFILCLTDSIFRLLRSTSMVPPGSSVILSASDVTSVLSEPNPLERLRGYLHQQIPYRRLIPFSVSDPEEGSMFVGRTVEVEMLVNEHQDFALCGPGGIGKTSLLRQMQWELRVQRNSRHSRLVEVDLLTCPRSLDVAANEIARRISSTSRAHEAAVADLDVFLRRTRSNDLRFKDGPIDLVLDEMDTILKLDREETDRSTGRNYPLMRKLRHARNSGAIRLTISGRTETENMLNDPDNPFVLEHSGHTPGHSRLKLLKLTPLHETEAFDLLAGPLQDLGYPVEERRAKLQAGLRDCEGIPLRIQNLGLDIANEVGEWNSRKRSQ